MATFHHILNADATRMPLADQSVDLVVESPPYMDARTYEDGLPAGQVVTRNCEEWVAWMLDVVAEGLRISRGPVIIVCAGVTRDRNYWPGPEGLTWEWFKRGGSMYRPCYWYRVGIPGSGGDNWFRADVEYCLCFKHPGPLPWSENTAMGHPPKWAPGGEMSYRTPNGSRVNQWGHSADSGATVQDGDFVRSRGKRPSHRVAKWGAGGDFPETRNGDAVRRRKPGEKDSQTRRKADGTRAKDGDYTEPVHANPGNAIEATWVEHDETFWLDIKVGGGLMGDRLCHENEAPFPELIPEFFIRSLCPPGGIVLDRFGGSGTTAAVAKAHGRNSISNDLRPSQCELQRRRLAGVQPPLFLQDAV